jgi:glycosidase
MPSDLLNRKRTHFVLWRPAVTNPAPTLVIGQFQNGNPPTFSERNRIDLAPDPANPDLWTIPAASCGLTDGQIYHYWFEVTDSDPRKSNRRRIRCTDPTAGSVDWRLVAPRLPQPYTEDDRDPAGVVRFSAGELEPCDPGGETPDWSGDPPIASLPVNRNTVIYELSTSGVASLETEIVALSAGTFRDARALIDTTAPSGNLAPPPGFETGPAYLQALGINALELLPPADSWVDREWGYATSNYFAADFDLGFPKWHASPTASSDLAALVKSCHLAGVRFFTDMVMAFATRWSYENVGYLDFHVHRGQGDPEDGDRQDFGGVLFKYNFRALAYDPIAGNRQDLVPARQIMRTHLVRWMQDFRVDGIRLDSVANYGNWDFIREVRDHARDLWRARAAGQGLPAAQADARFFVVAEELAVPTDLVKQGRVDALWNEIFKRMVRWAIVGRNDPDEPSFEWTVRKIIDCRWVGFENGLQAVNYVTSHDVGGMRNERLFNLLGVSGVPRDEDRARRMKLAFVCLMTAIGIPMIYAGEEFADQHDLGTEHPAKQVDPVNFGRLADPWRRSLFDYVARLAQLRTASAALASDDVDFFHVDFGEGKRVLAWRRGGAGVDPVVVVANFSDWGTPNPQHPAAEYVVNNWPATPAGRSWREVTQARSVPTSWVGREPIYPWEAKVYVLG